jgi:hypothetical protein
MTRKVYLRSKNNKYKYNSRYRRHTKKIVQSGGAQKTYYLVIGRDEDAKVKTDDIVQILKPYDDIDDNRVVVKENEYSIRYQDSTKQKEIYDLLKSKKISDNSIYFDDTLKCVVFSSKIDIMAMGDELRKIDPAIQTFTDTFIKIVVMINTESTDDVIIAALDKYIESTNLDKKFGSFVRQQEQQPQQKSQGEPPKVIQDKVHEEQSSYTIQALPNDPDVIAKAKDYFSDTKVAESPIVHVKQSVSGRGITVNAFIENLKKIKIKDKNGEETSLKISSQSPADGGTITIETPYKIVNTETEYGVPIQDGFKYVEVFADITTRLENDLEKLNDSKKIVKKTKDKSTIVVSDNPIKTDKNSREYPELNTDENKTNPTLSLKLPSGSKILKTFTESGTDAERTKRFTQTITGVGADIIGELTRKGLKVKIDGNDMKVTPKPGSKIDKIVNMNDYGNFPDGTVKYVYVFTNPDKPLLANLKLKNGILKTKGETATFISDTSIGQEENSIAEKTYLALKLPSGKVEEPAVKIDDANVDEKGKLEPVKPTKPVELLKALNDMPPSFSFINVGKPDEKFDDLYKVLIGDNDGLKVKGTGLFSKSTPIITKPTDNPTIFILYYLLVTLDKISSDVVVKKNAAAQFFNSLKEIFNSLYKGKEPPKESAAVKIESFIRKLYDPSYSQTKTNAEKLPYPAVLLRNTYTVALDVAKLVADKVTKSFEFPVKGGRLTRRRVLNRRNKKKSHRSKLN